MNLTFDHVHKQFGDLPVVDGFTSEYKTGELVALVGPSGCGKSTLLHLAAGLEKPTQGQVLADGKAVTGPHPSRTLVFQEHALYPWVTVEDNVAFGLECRGVPAKERRERARDWITKVGLNVDRDATKYPHELSGGMRQRVAIARTLILQPRIILMRRTIPSVRVWARRAGAGRPGRTATPGASPRRSGTVATW